MKRCSDTWTAPQTHIKNKNCLRDVSLQSSAGTNPQSYVHPFACRTEISVNFYLEQKIRPQKQTCTRENSHRQPFFFFLEGKKVHLTSSWEAQTVKHAWCLKTCKVGCSNFHTKQTEKEEPFDNRAKRQRLVLGTAGAAAGITNGAPGRLFWLLKQDREFRSSFIIWSNKSCA